MPPVPQHRVTLTLWVSDTPHGSGNILSPINNTAGEANGGDAGQSTSVAAGGGGDSSSGNSGGQPGSNDGHINANGAASADSGRYKYGVPLSTYLNPDVALNPDLRRNEHLGGLAEGDVLHVVSAEKDRGGENSGKPGRTQGDGPGCHSHNALLIKVTRSCWARDGTSAQLQISVASALGASFKLKNRDQVIVTKLPHPIPKDFIADHVELYFKDQYLGRADMHRLSLAIADTCIHVDQKVQLAGINIRATVRGIWIGGKPRRSAMVAPDTRTVFRSESAKYYIFVQLSKEMWTFDDDGSLFYEKVVDLFLPELFARWAKRETNHIVSLVLFARVLYDREEAEAVDRPVMGRSGRMSGGWSDVYKVIVDLEAKASWTETLRRLRAEFHNFREKILLASSPRSDGKQAGALSAAHEGGILEAINVALSAFDKHYVDRDLQRTGLSIVILTAGTSHFIVDKNLLRLTMERMVDEGVGVDCVSLAKMPLHAVPLLRYLSTTPSLHDVNPSGHLQADSNVKASDNPEELQSIIPHWWDSSFYAKHQDKPFRQDRFLPRCRMPAIQNIGRAEYENASIALPSLRDELEGIERHLSTISRDWQELSEREKRSRVFDRYDEIACGALGKWETLELDKETSLLGSGRRPRESSMTSTGNGRNSSKISSASSEDSMNAALVEGSFPARNNHTSRHAMRKVQTAAKGTAKPPPLDLSAAAVDAADARPDQARNNPRKEAVTPASEDIAVGMSSRPAQGRKRAESSATISTLSLTSSARRASSHLRSPSRSTLNLRNASVAPIDRRVASSSASSVTAVDSAPPPAGGASSALASLLATQAKLTGSANKTSSNTSERSGGWFWNRKAKAAPAHSKAASTTSTSRDVFASTNNHQSTIDDASRDKVQGSKDSSLPSRRSSAASAQPPRIASLSVTPATPAAAATTKADTKSASTSAQARPVSMQPTPAAFKVTSNDPAAEPLSLEEHSLHQYFFDAHRQSHLSKAAKQKLEAARSKRLARLNPSNPSRSSGMLQDQARRWYNIFPRAGRVNDQRSVKWKSLCTPACLPLYSDYLPPIDDPSAGYIRETYSLPVKTTSASFLLTAGKDLSETAGNLLRELVNQRLAKAFQIIMPAYDDAARRARIAKDGSVRTPTDNIVLGSARDVREILYNTPQGEGKAIYLGFATDVHRIRFDRPSSCIQVTTWRQQQSASGPAYPYTCTLWPASSEGFITRSVSFSYPTLGQYDWPYSDRLVAGMEGVHLNEKMRYWRARFVLIPAPVPDLQGMIRSQNRVLLDDSTEEDLRIAGVMTLYEQFSKVRWTPPTKDGVRSRLPPLSYSTTVLDPSLSAASEAERLAGESDIIPLPYAYGSEVFVDDYELPDIVKMMDSGPRPLRMQAKRKGFRTLDRAFSGEDMVTWIQREFADTTDRKTAADKANEFVDAGLVIPLNPPKRLLDNYSFYTFSTSYQKPEAVKKLGLSRLNSSVPTPEGTPIMPSAAATDYLTAGSQASAAQRSTSDGRLVLPMSHCILINLDMQRKSDRAETAFLHFDVAHNTTNGFHFQLDWLGTSRLVEDMLSYWQRTAEKYGLKMIEENVSQIKDIQLDNPLQAAIKVPLVLPPPVLPNLEELLSGAAVAHNYFENQLLRSLDYVLDVEADGNFPSTIETEYTYTKPAYDYTQFVHRSGACFVQCIGGQDGFLFLRNRLYLSHNRQPPIRHNTASSSSPYSHQVRNAPPPDEAKVLLQQLQNICSDPEELGARWDEMTSGFVAAHASGSVDAAAVSEDLSALADETARTDNQGQNEQGSSGDLLPAPLPPSVNNGVKHEEGEDEDRSDSNSNSNRSSEYDKHSPGQLSNVSQEGGQE